MPIGGDDGGGVIGSPIITTAPIPATPPPTLRPTPPAGAVVQRPNLPVPATPVAPAPQAAAAAEVQRELGVSRLNQQERTAEVQRALAQAAEFGVTVENSERLRTAYNEWQKAEAQVAQDQAALQAELNQSGGGGAPSAPSGGADMLTY